MDKYYVEKTKYTPRIDFSPEACSLRIEGDSYPENALETYQPLLEKIEEYFTEPCSKLEIELYVDYLNTSSSKIMTDLIFKLQSFHEQGHKIALTWFYPAEDIDCKETCDMFLEDVKFPAKIKALRD